MQKLIDLLAKVIRQLEGTQLPRNERRAVQAQAAEIVDSEGQAVFDCDTHAATLCCLDKAMAYVLIGLVLERGYPPASSDHVRGAIRQAIMAVRGAEITRKRAEGEQDGHDGAG